MRRFMLAFATFVTGSALVASAAFAGTPPVTFPTSPKGLPAPVALPSGVDPASPYVPQVSCSPVNLPGVLKLRALVLKTSGLVDVLREALAPAANLIRAAFVFGSVAKGEDTSASDIDLMVIAERLTYADLFAALEEASTRLGRKVAPTIYSPTELARLVKQDSRFVTRVLGQPKLWVIGGERDLAA